MKLPFELTIGDTSVNIHLILEYLAFFLAFRLYLVLRKNRKDEISTGRRWTIILGAALGALLGSRLFGYLENPIAITSANMIDLMNVKTIMGGLFGGLLGVELIKNIVGEKQSSGDLFTLPIILGIFVGRIGCFLSGVNEFTYGSPTHLIIGMDLGDGISRHPIMLYELIFLMLLFYSLLKIWQSSRLENGELFKLFMLLYFGFRFIMEFLKPNVFFILGLSSIQWLCVLCFLYYLKAIIKFIKYAH